MRPEYMVEPPSRRADGTWRFPLQIVIQVCGKYQKGHAHFETVGYASDLEHVARLRECLI